MLPEKPANRSESRKKTGMDPALIAWGVYGAVGFQLAATVVGGLLLGLWLDKKYGLSPWMTLAGMFVGSVGGFYNLIRVLTWHQGRRNGKEKS